MTLLSHVSTSLGRIELHWSGAAFMTRRTFRSAIDGRPRTTQILHGRKSAREWYELAEREGAVHEPFPEGGGDG
jgi:hypothetical protein